MKKTFLSVWVGDYIYDFISFACFLNKSCLLLMFKSFADSPFSLTIKDQSFLTLWKN